MTETAATPDGGSHEGNTRAAATPPAQPGGPTLHLNIEVHIPAEASPAQIDHIFSSMARHIRPKATGVGAT